MALRRLPQTAHAGEGKVKTRAIVEKQPFMALAVVEERPFRAAL
jgi:hypothetical protein